MSGQPGGIFLSVLDNFVIFARNGVILAFFIIITPIIIMFNTLAWVGGNALTRNTVQVVELNPTLRQNPTIPFMGLDRWDNEDRWCYAKFHSIRQAEKWLIKNNYQCRLIPTRQLIWDGDNIDKKYFAVKGSPGDKYESIVMLQLKTGADDPKLIPFRYAQKSNPMNWRRFKFNDSQAYANFELGYFSTDMHLKMPKSGSWDQYLSDRFMYFCGLQTWPVGKYDTELVSN